MLQGSHLWLWQRMDFELVERCSPHRLVCVYDFIFPIFSHVCLNKSCLTPNKAPSGLGYLLNACLLNLPYCIETGIYHVSMGANSSED